MFDIKLIAARCIKCHKFFSTHFFLFVQWFSLYNIHWLRVISRLPIQLCKCVWFTLIPETSFFSYKFSKFSSLKYHIKETVYFMAYWYQMLIMLQNYLYNFMLIDFFSQWLVAMYTVCSFRVINWYKLLFCSFFFVVPSFMAIASSLKYFGCSFSLEIRRYNKM